MKTFPMFLKVEGRRIVIVGGGLQAVRKCRLALKTEAEILVVAVAPVRELAGLAASGRIRLLDGPVGPELFAEAALVFVATGCKGADACHRMLAKSAGALVNVVDAPELCDAYTPAIVDRDPVIVAIGTEGTAPVLARQIKTRIESMLEPRLGRLAALAGRLRGAATALAAAERRALWRWVFSGAPRAAHGRGQEGEAARLVEEAIARSGPPDARYGGVSLVGAGPGCLDLMTLRGVQRLQEADVVFHDHVVDPELLELARRDAERVCVGKSPGVGTWPRARVDALVVAAARSGRRVVRLKCGDPGVLSSGAEEAAALEAAGIPWEIVPGVTAVGSQTSVPPLLQPAAPRRIPATPFRKNSLAMDFSFRE